MPEGHRHLVGRQVVAAQRLQLPGSSRLSGEEGDRYLAQTVVRSSDDRYIGHRGGEP